MIYYRQFYHSERSKTEYIFSFISYCDDTEVDERHSSD